MSNEDEDQDKFVSFGEVAACDDEMQSYIYGVRSAVMAIGNHIISEQGATNGWKILLALAVVAGDALAAFGEERDDIHRDFGATLLYTEKQHRDEKGENLH